jgi:hypothetical protein
MHCSHYSDQQYRVNIRTISTTTRVSSTLIGIVIVVIVTWNHSLDVITAALSAVIVRPKLETRVVSPEISGGKAENPEIRDNQYRLIHVMAAILDFLLTLTSCGMPISASAVPKPENIGLTVGITLISCIQAELYDIFKIYFQF